MRQDPEIDTNLKRTRDDLRRKNNTNQEAAVKCLSALPLDSIMSSPSFGRVCTTTRLPLHLSYASRILLGNLSITVII